MRTIKEVIDLSSNYLSSRRDAEELLAHTLGLKRIDLYLQFERPLEEEELTPFRELIKRRAKGEPIAYLTSSLSFYGVELNISPAVIIPRPETELLVDQIVNQLKEEDLEGKILWDLCTGSGCIAIALKKQFPILKVVASDICSKALECASLNARQNDARVSFKQGDLFAPFNNEGCDFFVCNPPYITAAEYALLDPQVKDFEPKHALTDGSDGLEFYQRVAMQLKKFLNPHGRGWLEIGTGQGEIIKKLFENKGWKGCDFSLDYAGHDRFFFLEKDSFNEVT